MALGWPFGPRHTAIIVAVVLLGFGMSPMRVANRAAFIVYHTPGAVFRYARLPKPAPHTLKAAILNVTADFNELTSLLQDFLHSPGVDPEVERQLRVYLAGRAVRSHPQLESALDWVLGLYKFAAPFLAISLLAKLTGAGGGGSDAPDDGVETVHAAPPAANLRAGARGGQQRRYEQQQFGAETDVAPPAPVATNADKRGAGGRLLSSPSMGPDTPESWGKGSALNVQLDGLAEPYRRRGAEDARVLL